MASPPFQYTPLPTPTSFRLLTLHPGPRNSDLHLTITTTTHASCPSYSALSYTWGPPHPQKPCYITTHPSPHPIQQNLHTALLHLRSSTQETALWVDSLCIDQSSIPERNAQVAMMGTIYSGAEEVIIWLGPKSRTSDVAMRWIDFCASPRRSSLGIMERLDGVSSRVVVERQRERWNALKHLCRRAYWSRVWIVQEVVLARKVVIRCGEEVAPWRGLARIFDGFEGIFCPAGARRDAGKVKGSLAEGIHRLRMMHESMGCTLGVLMNMTRESKCSDPRDKVFALLGLAADCAEGKRVEIDYSKGMENVVAGLWKFYVGSCEPSLVVRGSHALERILKESSLEGASIPNGEIDVVGRAEGNIVFVGKPWNDEESKKMWYEQLGQLSMVQDQNRSVPVERNYQSFCSALAHTTAADSDRLGTYVESEESEMNRRQLQSSLSSRDLSKTKRETAFEALGLPNSSFWEQDGEEAEYKKHDVFIGSRGQFGIAPEGTMQGDEICQFQESNISIIVRRQRGSGEGRTELIGKALLTRTRDESLGQSRVETVPWESAETGLRTGFPGMPGNLGDRRVHLKISSRTLRWLTRNSPPATV